MVGCNVVAHIPDLNGTMEGVATLLADEGVFQVEAPYLLELLDRAEFDTIYHEHFFYFSLRRSSADRAPRAAVFDVEYCPTSTVARSARRVPATARHTSATPAGARRFAREERRGRRATRHLRRLRRRASPAIRESLLELLGDSATAGSGSPPTAQPRRATRCSTTAASGRSSSPTWRQEPAQAGPVHARHAHAGRSEARRLRRRPDYTLILAWNMADEIVAEQAVPRRAGASSCRSRSRRCWKTVPGRPFRTRAGACRAATGPCRS